MQRAAAVAVASEAKWVGRRWTAQIVLLKALPSIAANPDALRLAARPRAKRVSRKANWLAGRRLDCPNRSWRVRAEERHWARALGKFVAWHRDRARRRTLSRRDNPGAADVDASFVAGVWAADAAAVAAAAAAAADGPQRGSDCCPPAPLIDSWSNRPPALDWSSHILFVLLVFFAIIAPVCVAMEGQHNSGPIGVTTGAIGFAAAFAAASAALGSVSPSLASPAASPKKKKSKQESSGDDMHVSDADSLFGDESDESARGGARGTSAESDATEPHSPPSARAGRFRNRGRAAADTSPSRSRFRFRSRSRSRSPSQSQSPDWPTDDTMRTWMAASIMVRLADPNAAALSSVSNKAEAVEMMRRLQAKRVDYSTADLGGTVRALLLAQFDEREFHDSWAHERVSMPTPAAAAAAADNRCRVETVLPMRDCANLSGVAAFLKQEANIKWGQPKSVAVTIDGKLGDDFRLDAFIDATNVFPSPFAGDSAHKYKGPTQLVLLAIRFDSGDVLVRKKRGEGEWMRHHYSAELDQEVADFSALPIGCAPCTAIYVAMGRAEAEALRHKEDEISVEEQAALLAQCEQAVLDAEQLVEAERLRHGVLPAEYAARLDFIRTQIRAAEAAATAAAPRDDVEDDEAAAAAAADWAARLQRLCALLVQESTQHLSRDKLPATREKRNLLDETASEAKVLASLLDKHAPFRTKDPVRLVDVASLEVDVDAAEDEETVEINGDSCNVMTMKDNLGNKVKVLCLLHDTAAEHQPKDQTKLDVDWMSFKVEGWTKGKELIKYIACSTTTLGGVPGHDTFHLCGKSDAIFENVFEYSPALKGHTHLMLQSTRNGYFVMVQNVKPSALREVSISLHAQDTPCQPYISSNLKTPSSLTGDGLSLAPSKLFQGFEAGRLIETCAGGVEKCVIVVGSLGRRQPIQESGAYFHMLRHFASAEYKVLMAMATYWQFDGVALPAMDIDMAREMNKSSDKKKKPAAAEDSEDSEESEGESEGESDDDDDEDENAPAAAAAAAADGGGLGCNPVVDEGTNDPLDHHATRRYDQFTDDTAQSNLSFSGPCGQFRGLLAGHGLEGVAARLLAKGSDKSNEFVQKLTMYFPALVHGFKCDKLWHYCVEQAKVYKDLGKKPVKGAKGLKSDPTGRRWCTRKEIVPKFCKRLKDLQEAMQSHTSESLHRMRVEVLGRLDKKTLLDYVASGDERKIVTKFTEVIRDARLWRGVKGLKVAVISADDFFASQGHARIVLENLVRVVEKRLMDRVGPEDRTATMQAFAIIFESTVRSYTGLGLNEYDWGLGIVDLELQTPAEKALEQATMALKVLKEGIAHSTEVDRAKIVAKSLLDAHNSKERFPLPGKFRGCRAQYDAIGHPARFECVGLTVYTESSFQLGVKAPTRIGKPGGGGHMVVKSGLGNSKKAFSPTSTVEALVLNAAAFLVAQNKLPIAWTPQQFIDGVLQFAIDEQPAVPGA